MLVFLKLIRWEPAKLYLGTVKLYICWCFTICWLGAMFGSERLFTYQFAAWANTHEEHLTPPSWFDQGVEAMLSS
jgi:hypothetical protein